MILVDLSEVGEWRVLLLETGEDESEASDVPALANRSGLIPYDRSPYELSLYSWFCNTGSYE